MTQGDADTWDPDIHGIDQETGNGPVYPGVPESPDQLPYPPMRERDVTPDSANTADSAPDAYSPITGESPTPGSFTAGPLQAQGPMSPQIQGAGQNQGRGVSAQQNSRYPGYSAGHQGGQPAPGRRPSQALPSQHSQAPQARQGSQQRSGSALAATSAEHYADRSVLPWWAWSAIGAVLMFCGILVWIAASPSSLGPGSIGFNPKLHEDYRDMKVLGVSETYSETLDDVPWDLKVMNVLWDADEQVAAETSMVRPAAGMRYVGVELEASTNYMNTSTIEETFIFYYVSPAGQQYSEHYCSTGCLSEDAMVSYVYDGWIYFEVPEDVMDGGYLRVNLLYSSDKDTLMELQ